MNERGKVTKIKRGNATVTFDRKSACDQCRMCAASKSGKTVEVTVPNKLNAAVGDTVEVTMGSKYVLTAVFIVYVIPLILVTISVFAFRPLGDLAQIIATVVSVFLGLFIAVMLDKYVIRKKKGFVPEMTRIVTDEDAVELCRADNASVDDALSDGTEDKNNN